MTDNFSIYAELLPNIRQVSVVVSLPSPCDSSTRALFLSDGSRIHVTHHDDSRLLELPAAVVLNGSGNGSSILPLKPAAADRDCKLTWRFPLDLNSSTCSSSPAATRGGSARGDGGTGSSVPWEAVKMATGSPVRCRGCNAVVVPDEQVREWQDLPSANWAEMMEFWHCHKPDDHEGQDGRHHHRIHGPDKRSAKGGEKADEQTLARRGYGANSSIQARRGTGFVDLTNFLFDGEDCRGVEIPCHDTVDASSAVRFLPVKCVKCLSKIGQFSISTPAVTLYKWQVLVDNSNKSSTPPSDAQCLAASLLASIARSGSSKCLVMPMTRFLSEVGQNGKRNGRALHTWILNSTISYTSTKGNSTRTPAIKLLFRIISEDEADKMLESFSSDDQDVSFPEEALESVIDALQHSNMVLPASDRNFQGWTVGLLERWDSD